MNVKQFAASFSISADTVRYYTRIGYLTPRKNENNGYREYLEKDKARLKFILAARQLEFSVEDIGLILNEASKGRSACPLVREIIQKRLEETEIRFLQTIELRKKMVKASKEWESMPNREPTGSEVCHLIENLKF